VVVFSLALVVVELKQLCDFSPNKNFKTYLRTTLPLGGISWQLISLINGDVPPQTSDSIDIYGSTYPIAVFCEITVAILQVKIGLF
jgi:hypothetical protein